MKASDFVKRDLHVARGASAFILHTRFATQGLPQFNENNHPVVAGHIVGVHNGVLSNDWGIFSEIGWDKQKAEVDSEAIFALLAYGDMKPADALQELKGSAACAWLDTGEEGGRLHVARVQSSPLFIVESRGGSQVFASTADAATNAMQAVGMVPEKVRDIEEGRLFVIDNGEFTEVESFQPRRSYSQNWTGYRHTPTTTGTLDTRTRSVALVQSKDGDDTGDIEWKDDIPSLVGRTPTAPPARFIKTDLFGDDFVVTYEPEEYPRRYSRREDAINYYYQQIAKSGLTSEQKCEAVEDAAHALHGLLRPGDRVESVLHGHIVEGQVVTLPESFPEGQYLLRLEVPIENERDEWEYVLVMRDAELFYALKEGSNTCR